MSDTTAHAYCPECGPATVPHWIERTIARMDFVLQRVNRPFEATYNVIKPIVNIFRPGRLAPAVAAVLGAWRLGKILNEPDEKLNWRSRVIWEEARRRGIVMREFRPFGLPREIFFASYGGDTITFDGLPKPRSARDTSISWLDDKGEIIERFQKAGIPVPAGRSCTTFREAEDVFRKADGPVIVKPNLGSRSRHTYVHLTDAAALRTAFDKAKQLSPWVVVEEELHGYVFRVTIVNGAVAGMMRRESPHVIGDGSHTERELATEENRNPLRRGPIFHELPIDHDAEIKLKKQRLTLDAVPKRGQMVIMNDKVSRSYGASTTEITDIHPDNQALFVNIGALLGEPFVGIDIMMDDMAKSWREQKKCGVIECNSLPFIDLHHFPLKGPAKNVAGLVWDMIFPGSEKK